MKLTEGIEGAESATYCRYKLCMTKYCEEDWQNLFNYSIFSYPVRACLAGPVSSNELIYILCTVFL